MKITEYFRKSGFNDFNMLRLKTNLSPTNCDGFMSIVGQERLKHIQVCLKWLVMKFWYDILIDIKIPMKNGRRRMAAIIKVEFNVKAGFQIDHWISVSDWMAPASH